MPGNWARWSGRSRSSRGDRIVAVGDQIDGSAQETLDFPDAMLLPGLVDMHAHPAREGSKVRRIDP